MRNVGWASSSPLKWFQRVQSPLLLPSSSSAPLPCPASRPEEGPALDTGTSATQSPWLLYCGRDFLCLALRPTHPQPVPKSAVLGGFTFRHSGQSRTLLLCSLGLAFTAGSLPRVLDALFCSAPKAPPSDPLTRHT